MDKKTDPNFKKNFVWNTIGTLLNSSTSLFFLILVTRINGVNDAGIFSLGFSFACMMFFIGIYNGRVFQVTEHSKISDKSFFIAKIITTIVMIAASLIYLLIKSYDPYKFIAIFCLCIYKALEAFADVIYGYFQKYDELYLAGISLTLKSIFGLLAFLIIDLLTNNFLFSIFAMIVISILVLIFFDFRKSRKYHFLKSIAKKTDLISILKNGFFPFALSFLSLLVINSPKYAIDDFLSSDYQTYFGIIVMPATVITMFAQFIVYPFLTEINRYIDKKQFKKIYKLTIKINSILFILGVICVFAAFLFGIPVLQFIYGVNLESLKTPLIIIMIGAIFCACTYVFSNILISLRKLKFQTLLYTIIALISIFLARSLVQSSSIEGACYSYLISMVLLFVSYSFLTYYDFKNPKELK